MGVEEKTRRKKCKVRFSLIKKIKVFHKSSMKVGGQEVAANGDGTSKSVESACSGNGSLRKIKIKEADGNSGQEGVDFALFFWKRLALEWKKSSPL